MSFARLFQNILSRQLVIDLQAGKFRTTLTMKYRPAVYWAAQSAYWGQLRLKFCTQKVKSMLGLRWLHWPLTCPCKRRLPVAPADLDVSPPTAVGFGGIPHHVASPDR